MRGNIVELQESWELALRAERKSAATIEQYTIGLRLYVRWCTQHGHEPDLDRNRVRAFVDNLITAGSAPATAALRLQALKQFARWLFEEDELDENPLAGLKTPKVDVRVVDVLTEDDLRVLFKACQGPEFRDRRDEAICRLLAETGLRAGELLRLTVDDVDLRRGLAVIHKAKNGRGRVVPFGPQTGRALDRYIRVRRKHRLANMPELWLGDNSRGTIAYHGLRDAIMRRAELAGLRRFHLHKLRHTMMSRWSEAGGSEGGAMAIMGWRNRAMLDRYAAATAGDRAAQEARKLNLGDI
jgi:site-specific recombinase XerD